MDNKKMIISFSLRDGAPVEAGAEFGTDARELCTAYYGAADGFLAGITDEEDGKRERSLDALRDFCRASSVPAAGCGGIKRLEDVKKIIYAGCNMAVLDLSLDSNRGMVKEACERFGKDHIGGSVPEGTALADPAVADCLQYCSLLFVTRAAQDEAAETGVPYFVVENSPSVRDGKDILAKSGTCGFTSNAAHMTPDVLRELRADLAAAGISLKGRHAAFKWEDFKKGPDGLLPVVVQEDSTDQVLMVAYMNEQAYKMTVRTGRMTYYSRSRRSLWIKGETSGHFQYVRSLHGDCDMDTLLARVEQFGAACHTGSHSCFFQSVVQDEKNSRMQKAEEVLRQDYETILDRKEHPAPGSYTNYLFDKGIDKMLKKLGEEATEIVIAAKNPNPNEIVYEIADYLYHLMVVMAEKGLTWDDVTAELVRRQKKD